MIADQGLDHHWLNFRTQWWLIAVAYLRDSQLHRMRIAILLTLTNCMHAIPLGPVEQCSTQAMVVDGVSMSSGTATGVAFGGGITTVARARSYEQGVSCRRPTTPAEVCERVAGDAGINVKYDYSPEWRNALIFLGYVVFIVPGIVESTGFEVERNDVIDRASAAYQTAYSECMLKLQTSEEMR